MPVKRYKLFSTSDDGKPQPCAFFLSGDGCRNGVNCKFLHAISSEPEHREPEHSDVGLERENGAAIEKNVVPIEEKSVVSSESGEVFEQSSHVSHEQPMEDGKEDNPFADVSVGGTKRKSRRGTNNDSPFPKARKLNSGEKTQTCLETTPKYEAKKKSNASTASDAKATTKAATTTSSSGKSAGVDFRSLDLPIADFAMWSASNHAKIPADGLDFRSLNLPIADIAMSSVSNHAKTPAGEVDFRSLNLPIADFALSSVSNYAKNRADETSTAIVPNVPKTGKPPLPLPKSTETGRKWLKVVEKCQADARFEREYVFAKYIAEDEPIGGQTAWIKAKPFGDWCKDHPQVIAIDCEMCETEDPVSKRRNPSALCRVSIVDAVTDEILLNTLVKPEWPVVNYRTFINGISENELRNVQFTIRHCQAFMMALCSEETVILGHAVHHDFKSMRMEHYCVGDSALLFRSTDSEFPTVSLKDLSFGIFKKEMPKQHDSVNDARAALRCLEFYLENDGNVENIVRRAKENRVAPSQLFIHRIPRHVTTKHLAEMFLNNAKVVVEKVEDIDFSAGGKLGKTVVTFPSVGHANLAFSTLPGDHDEDTTGRLQKKIFLRGGQYIRIRKMVHEKTNNKSVK